MWCVLYPPATQPSFISKNFQNFQDLHQKTFSICVMSVIIYPPATHPSFTSKNFQNFQVLHQKKTFSICVMCVIIYPPATQPSLHTLHSWRWGRGEGFIVYSKCPLRANLSSRFLYQSINFIFKRKRQFLHLAVHWWLVRFPDPPGSVGEPD